MSFDPTGYTLAHEHLHIDLSGFKNNVDCRLDQYAFICQEMNDLMTRGVRNVIEMTNRYMGRNAQFMLDVMRETGINVVACTGYLPGRVFPGTCGDPAACRNWRRRWSMKLNRVSMARS
ncbi:phosphotriesterase-like protein [Escherichia coli]|uniref:Phosphotriesterase-like protein n=1 Tax=Escherichia coli TaxID=562 RepID=A0A376RBY0_ECOLX|nr:phosphotriesterase-like protein [Escherichia coli]